jgi:crotonobetainyl-CoA:carnitine CoA-transferase CaiB-like acyl-CoA transferase
VNAVPGLVWITITAHGIAGDAANWIGFGDDCGVAGGLSAALRDATGEIGIVGDAIGDPLTGIYAARMALEQRRRGTGARLVVSMSGVAALALTEAWPC